MWSMSRKDHSPDNSRMEGFFGEDWRGVTVEEFADEIDCYIRWYNEKRVKRSLRGMSPLQYRRSLGFVA